MDHLQSTSAASTTSLRARGSPRLDSTMFTTSSTALCRVPTLSVPTNRLGARSLESAASAFSSLLPMAPGATLQVSYTTEGNRFDMLKSTAGELMNQQISLRTEQEMSVRSTAFSFPLILSIDTNLPLLSF